VPSCGSHALFVSKLLASVPSHPAERSGVKEDSGPQNRIDKEKLVLTRPSQQHLDDAEIDALVSVPGRGVDSHYLSEHALGDAQRHVESCEDCDRKVQMHKRVQSEILRLGPTGFVQLSSDCPNDVDWLNVAAGIVAETKAKELISHATQCDHCGPLLRHAADFLSDEATSGEEHALVELKSVRPDWQRDLAEKLGSNVRQTPIEKGGISRWWRRVPPRWVLAGVFLALLFVGSWWGISVFKPPTAEGLLAKAYTEHRTLEMRISGAEYAPLRLERGKVGSNLDRSRSLLKAESLIREKLEREPNDTRWLQAKARADLLDGNYDAAIESLQRVNQADPRSAQPLIDLGTAYFQRAEATGRSSDYATAIESLSKAIAKSPDDPVALFNRAIAFERAYLYVQSSNDWKHYLRVDPNSDWSSEAETRLTAVEENLRKKGTQNATPLGTPTEFVEAAESGQGMTAGFDNRAERYLELAITNWLPMRESNSAKIERSKASTTGALTLLAQDLRTRHQDEWLTDFLAESHVKATSVGLRFLTKAIRSNLIGDHNSGLHFADHAAKAFSKEGNEAGQFRAELEAVYSDHLAARANFCRDKANSLLAKLGVRQYVWIETQTLLEASACAAEMSQVDQATATVQTALKLAKTHQYGNLTLRATVFAAGLAHDPERSFRYLHKGLGEYWSGDNEPMRGYSLYAVMDTTADQLGLWFYDSAVIREGLNILADDPDIGLRGIEQYRLARAELMTGDVKQAERDFLYAHQLLERSSSRNVVADISIDLAETYTQLGRYPEALELLGAIQPQLSHDILTGRFYAARAAALLGTGRNAEAEGSLAMAIRISERGLASIKNERERFDWIQAFKPAYRSLVQLRFSESADSSFRWWESFKGASLRTIAPRRFRPFHDPELPKITAWPSKRASIVSYAVFPEGVAIWLFDGANVHSHWLRVRAYDLDLLSRRFSEACASPDSEMRGLEQQGRELYNMLVKPLEPWLDGSSLLIIETDEILEMIPFEALVDNHGKFLSDAYEMSYSPGVFYLAAFRNTSRVDRYSAALVVGDPLSSESGGFVPLSDALDESHDVASLFHTSRLLLRQDANLPAILRELPHSAVFHFAGHAVANEGKSGLILSDSGGTSDDTFTVLQLDRQSLRHIHLVVLSACATVRGPSGALSDRDSLARTLLGAGVPQVVASRWVVDSSATREWMRVFYANLLAGHGASEAARESMIAIRGSVQWRHPFYWAAFSAFGLSS
jgi:CHAT domain-containing protein/Flp pilus assembly protein TadD